MQEFSENQLGTEQSAEPTTADRRRHHRYMVDGEAEVIFGDGIQLVRGSILDISLSGCFIATSARIQAAPGARASLVFRAAGVKLRASASLRAVRRGKGAGFLFVGMDERAKDELERLIAALEHRSD